jgi:hypothetical protein
MPVDERARHRLYLRLEGVLGSEEAGTLMNQLPPAGFDQLATKADVAALRNATKADVAALRADLEAHRSATKADMDALRGELIGRMDVLEHRLTARMERFGRQLVMWGSSMVLATGAFAFAAGRFA